MSAPLRLPRHAPGLAIGLLGGSFDPPHAGHRLVSLTALSRLRLDAVWWLVTPGNPLKDTGRLAPLAERLEACRLLAAHPRIAVTDLEARIGSRWTIGTIDWLTRRLPGVRFVWLMGSDNLAEFHRWRHWRAIAARLPFAVVDRPGTTLKAARSRAAVALAGRRLREHEAGLLAWRAPPAWVFLHGRRSMLSSTGLRRKRKDAAK